jgi:protocatechuate 3,4-dioxygenase beta subunit
MGQRRAQFSARSTGPAHIHLLISADGFVPVTTHLFVKGDQYLDSDAVFGTKDSLHAGMLGDHRTEGVSPLESPYLTSSFARSKSAV